MAFAVFCYDPDTDETWEYERYSEKGPAERLAAAMRKEYFGDGLEVYVQRVEEDDE